MVERSPLRKISDSAVASSTVATPIAQLPAELPKNKKKPQLQSS